MKQKKSVNFTFLLLLTAFVILGGVYITFLSPNRKTARKDAHCGRAHVPTTIRPTDLKTATDWLTLGDYDYESGNCQQAIEDLNQALALNPKYAEAYNNRGYVYMRLQNYEAALADLNRAIELRPDYATALRNRGDIYNYYYQRDRNQAIADYDKVVSLGKNAVKGSSVCTHRLLAVNHYNFFKTIWQYLTKNDPSGCLRLQSEP